MYKNEKKIYEVRLDEMNMKKIAQSGQNVQMWVSNVNNDLSKAPEEE